VAERSGDTAFERRIVKFCSCDARPRESGVALCFPPQSENLVAACAALRLRVWSAIRKSVFIRG